MIRTYSELCSFDTLDDRYEYLKLGATVGDATFGLERSLNQRFYRSVEWQQARDFVKVRDYGYDLGVVDVPIYRQIYVHHMNPLTIEDIETGSDNLLDPEGLISVSHGTHNAIHYGDKSQIPQPYVPRRPGDTGLSVPNPR